MFCRIAVQQYTSRCRGPCRRPWDGLGGSWRDLVSSPCCGPIRIPIPLGQHTLHFACNGGDAEWDLYYGVAKIASPFLRMRQSWASRSYVRASVDGLPDHRRYSLVDSLRNDLIPTVPEMVGIEKHLIIFSKVIENGG